MTAPEPKCKRCGQLQSVCDEQTDTSGFPDPWDDAPKPAPSAEPDLEQVDKLVDALNEHDKATTHTAHDVFHLLRALSRAGLAIVPAADVPSAEERKVLEAMGDISDPVIELNQGLGVFAPVIQAELARRAAKEGKTDGA